MKRDASALLITRGHGPTLEVFLAERAPQLRFFGGYWALPGGTRNPEDGDDVDGSDLLPLQRCAVRELFEETGILRTQRAPKDVDLRRLRAEMLEREKQRRKEPFDRWVELSATCVPQALPPVCRIETPPFAPVRYDTVFFHVPLASGESPEIIAGELVGGQFWKPKDAMAAWTRGALRIVPPVLILLERLVDTTIDAGLLAIRETAESYAAGTLHRVRFSPGIVMAPLRTPTLPPATTTNCYLVGEDKLVVIDPGSPYPDEQQRLMALLDTMQAEGRTVDAIVLTHHHPDHVGGVSALSQARNLPVHGHPITLDRLDGPFRRGRDLHDGDVIELGRSPTGQPWSLRALFTPGHDRGHLAYIDSQYGTGIVGDMLSTVSTIVIDPPEGHLRTYMESLERLRQEPLTTLYPAHGPAVRDGQNLVGDYIEHRKRREASLVDALDPSEPQRLDELVAKVYWDAPEPLRPVAERSLLAGLEKLQEDGAATELQGRGWIAVGP